jgi:glutamate/tyrosine decarboxylase-like PLP-dependent enzyme
VDGAYGAFGVLDPEVKPLFAGLSEADSIAVDPHKWLAVPLGCGTTFVRDRELLARAFTLEPAEYLEGSVRQVQSIGSQFDDFGHVFHHFTVEQSAQSRGVTVWAALKEIGAEGMRARVHAHNSFARQLAARVQASPVLELVAPVTLSICCFRYVPLELRATNTVTQLLNGLNREILKRLHHEHRYVPSSTELNGAFAIRPCYINPRTTSTDVDGLFQAVERIGGQVWREHQCQDTVP